MSATLPLPLELTEAAVLDRDPDTNLTEMFQVGSTRYNAWTQVRENQAGVPMILNGSLITLFQPYIHKAADLRCVVIGDNIFTAKINSQADERTSTDWRAGTCQHEHFSLPEQVQAAIHRLMNSFGINFASLDMILTPEGEFVFLKLNPNGQWLWIEFELGLPLLKTFVDMLTSTIR